MELYGNGNEVWEIDEGLRETAGKLINKFPDSLGHVEISRVIFVRVTGVKLKKEKNWYGKCWLVKPPLSIISRYTLKKLGHAGAIDLTQLENVEDILDTSYIIGINTDAIEMEGGNIDKIEEVTLHHEMLHISPCMTKLITHNVQDFTEILDRYGVYWSHGVIEEKDANREPAFLDNFVSKLVAGGNDISGSYGESD